MKVITDRYIMTPLKIDGTTSTTIEFETGDVFVNQKEELIAILLFESDHALMINSDGKTFKEFDMLRNEWCKNYRYVGKIGDGYVANWEHGLSLI